LRGLFVAESLQAAENDREPPGVIETIDLIVDRRSDLAVFHGVSVMHGHLLTLEPFAAPRPLELQSRALGDATRHAVKPSRECVAVADRMGTPGQDEKGRLKRILGQVVVAKQATANAEDHRPVPFDQRGEREFGDVVGSRQKGLEQPTVSLGAENTQAEQRL
jgi:hypothetical protein